MQSVGVKLETLAKTMFLFINYIFVDLDLERELQVVNLYFYLKSALSAKH